MTEPLRFVPHASAVEVGFWHVLSRLKLNEWKLSQGSRNIPAERRSSHEESSVAWTELSAGSLSQGPLQAHRRPGHFSVRVELVNFNTIEEFKSADRVGLARATARAIVEASADLSKPVDEQVLSGCILHTFADIKKWRFMHWFCFPAVVPHAPLQRLRAPLRASEYLRARAPAETSPEDTLSQWAAGHLADPREIFAVRCGGDDTSKLLTLSELDDELLLADRSAPSPDAARRLCPGGDLMIAVADHSGLPGAPGSTVRNAVAMAVSRYAPGATEIAVLCLRVDRSGAGDTPTASRSIVVEVGVPAGAYDTTAGTPLGGGGWESNAKGKPGPRSVDLGSQMDPVALAEGSVDLNLKLMRWRLMPTLDLEGIAAQRCLLLGSGTLGCNVARTLMGWGVRAITMLDNGRVSYSNPVRQSLFTHADCADGGKPKGPAAAERLREIFPSMEANGVQLSIPMAGHPIGAEGSTPYTEAKAEHDRLRDLIASHDVVFLLTDSRESRWLPTLIARETRTPLINAALGFDSYVVMRHGVGETEQDTNGNGTTDPGKERGHGCYFCNDCAAPLDSLSSRTLDQQCTVTRPGLSYLASATAVELLVTVLNHPDKWMAPAATALPTTERTEHPLGIAPQQVRGFMTHMHNAIVATVRSDRCTACSPGIVREYREKGFEVVARACNEPSYLEDLTGLTELFAEADAAFAAIEAVSDDEDDW